MSGVDPGPEWAGLRIGRPATSGLNEAGYRHLADLPEDLDTLLTLHGVGPKAVWILAEARAWTTQRCAEACHIVVCLGTEVPVVSGHNRVV